METGGNIHKMEGVKPTTVDEILDEISLHRNKIASLEGQLNNILLESSDAENRDEMQQFKSVHENPVSNPLVQKIEEEKHAIEELENNLRKVA